MKNSLCNKRRHTNDVLMKHFVKSNSITSCTLLHISTVRRNTWSHDKLLHFHKWFPKVTRIFSCLQECVAISIDVCPQSNPVQLGIQVDLPYIPEYTVLPSYTPCTLRSSDKVKWLLRVKTNSKTWTCTSISSTTLLKLQHILSHSVSLQGPPTQPTTSM